MLSPLVNLAPARLIRCGRFEGRAVIGGGDRLPQPYYSDEAVAIYHGDCLEVLTSWAFVPVDLVVTSPPYNLGMHPTGRGSGMHAGSGYTANGKVWTRVADLAGGYGSHDDAMPQVDYDRWQTEVVQTCWSVLAEKGAIFYNHKPRPMNGELHLPLRYGEGLPLRQIITWDRGVAQVGMDHRVGETGVAARLAIRCRDG